MYVRKLDSLFIYLLCFNSLFDIIDVGGQVGKVNVSECGVDKINYVKPYNIFSLVSFNATTLTRDIVRFHLKLRYIVAAQLATTMDISPKTIGFKLFNACDDVNRLVSGVLEIFLKQVFNPLQKKITNCGGNTHCKLCTCSPYDSSNTIAVVSFLPYHYNNIVANLLSSHNIPLFAVTTENHPDTHPNFLKLYFPSYDQLSIDIDTIVNKIRDFRIRNILLLILPNSNENLVEMHASMLWQQIRDFDHNICIERLTSANQASYNNQSDYNHLIHTINQNHNLQLIVIWCRQDIRDSFLKQAKRINNKNMLWVWYSDLISKKDVSFSGVTSLETLRTHFFLIHPMMSFQRYNYQHYRYSDIKRNVYIRSNVKGKTDKKKLYDKIVNDPLIQLYFRETGGFYTDELDMIASFDHKETLLDDMIEAVLLPLWVSNPSGHIRMNKTIKYLRMVIGRASNNYAINFPYGTDKYESWRYNTRAPEVVIRNVKIFRRECEKLNCPPGYFPKREEFKGMTNHSKYNWHCVHCPENNVKNEYGSSTCRPCSKYMLANKNKTGCYDPYETFSIQVENGAVVITLLVQGLTAVCGMFVTFVFVKYRNTPIVMSSDFTASILSIICHTLLTIILPSLYIQKPSDLVCKAQPLVIGILLTIIFSITLTKTQKTLLAFQSKVRLTKKMVTISKSVEIFVNLVLLLLFILVVLITYLAGSPVLSESVNHQRLSREWYCGNMLQMNVVFVFVLAITVFAAVQAFRARTLPRQFNETIKITYCLFVTIVVVGVRFPIAYGQEQPTLRSMVDFYVITVINTIHFALIYSVRTYVVLFQPNMNTKEYFRAEMLKKSNEKAKRKIATTAQF